MASQNPIQEFESLLQSSSFLFIVYYRGHWCHFCASYLTALQTLTSQITAAGGKTLIVTAEPSSCLPLTRSKTGYDGAAIVDPEHKLLKELKARGVVDVAITEKKGYEFGMAQPAVVVLKKDGTVLESWAIIPSAMNFGGAKDRPDLKQIWENVDAKLHDKKVVYRAYKKQGANGLLMGKVFG